MFQELTSPKPEEPNLGFLIPNVELPPLCSARFRPGPPSDQAQVVTNLVAELLANSGCVDLRDLCIAAEHLVWVLRCDLICLDHDGAVLDACVIALIAALRTGKCLKSHFELRPSLRIQGAEKGSVFHYNEISL